MLTLMIAALATQPGADIQGGYDKPARPDTTTTVVVSRTADGWLAEYKGRSTTFPAALDAKDVERLAGEFGRKIDTPPTRQGMISPAYTFPSGTFTANR